MTYIVKTTLQREHRLKTSKDHFKLNFSCFYDKLQSQVTKQTKNKSPKIPDAFVNC